MSSFAQISEDPSRLETSKIRRTNVLGVMVSAIDRDRAWGAVSDALDRGRRGYISVTGVHGVCEALRDESFREILNDSLLNTPDGVPLVWMGRLQGYAEIDRVYGPDFMLDTCGRGLERGMRHFLCGGPPGLAERLKGRLEQRFPGIEIVGTYTPPFRPLNEEEEAELIAQCAATKPDMIWVGLSTPKQERFMREYLPKLDTTLMAGVGAAFDFHAGTMRQAPQWMQEIALEWFFRMCSEPGRLAGRYLRNNPTFLFHAAAQLLGCSKYPHLDQAVIPATTPVPSPTPSK